MEKITFKFNRDEQAEREEFKLAEERKGQGPSVRSLDLMTFLPGVSDQLYLCPCGKRMTWAGDPCSLCKGGKA